MSVVKEKILQILDSAEIRLPRDLGEIVIEYYLTVEGILAQEHELYTLLQSFGLDNIASDHKEYFHYGRTKCFIEVCQSIQANDDSEISSVNARNALADFVIRQGTYYSLRSIPKDLFSLEDLIFFYTKWLPSHKQKIISFLESIIIFTDTYIAIKYTQEELNFLLKQLRSKQAEITPEGGQQQSTVTEVNQDTLENYSNDYSPSAKLNSIHPSHLNGAFYFDDIYFNAEQRILYINKERTRVIAKFQNLSKEKLEYEKTKNRLNSSELPAIDELLQLDERLRNVASKQWLLKDTKPNLTAIYPVILRAIKEETLVVIDIEPTIGKSLRPFSHPTHALAFLITGLPIKYEISLGKKSRPLRLIETRGLLKHFHDVKFALGFTGYPLAEKLMVGMLLYANTHVCITVKPLCYEKIKKQLKIELNKLEQDNQLTQLDQFQTQLNERLPACLSSQPVGLITVQKEGIKLYVDVFAKEAIATLTACVSEVPLALSNEYQAAVMKVISSLKSPSSSSIIFYSRERNLLQPLVKKFQQQAGTVVDPKSGSQCLKDFQAQIEQFMQDNRNILKIRKNAPTTRILIAIYEAAREQIKLFEQTFPSSKRQRCK